MARKVLAYGEHVAGLKQILPLLSYDNKCEF